MSLETHARVLLVDEEHADYMLLAHLLASVRRQHYNLAWCREPEQALERLLSGEYQVALLDCQRRPRRALKLLKTATEHDCPLPLIAITGEADEALEAALLAAGACDVLVKTDIDLRLIERALRYAVERKQVEQRLSHQAQFDPLTGIPNRLLFRDRLNHALERARNGSAHLALLHLDLDGFRRVNESFGFDAGDQLIRQAARRLQDCIHQGDSVARVGADEFTVMLEEVRQLSDVTAVANKIVQALGAAYSLRDHSIVLPVSIGISVYPEAGADADTLMRNADLALAEAKRLRGCQYRFYSERMNLQAVSQMHLEADLRRALRRNEFELFYQPRVELESGETAGVEALIRWRHPERGLLGPAEFIPLAEEVGLIVPLGYWVIQQACADLKRLDRLGHRHLDVAVNLSFKQLQDPNFVTTATRLINHSGIDPRRLEFELTETAIMSNAEETYRSMRALGKLGVTFSLDDFGTGYSSFAHIQRLPISALKIDRSFIQTVLTNEDDAIIVKAIINLAHSLQLQVIAEGVETLEQVQFLWQYRCHQVQGFYFSPATPVDHLLQILQERATATL